MHFFHRRCMKLIWVKLNARVKIPFIIGQLKPPVASVMAIKVIKFSRLEVLGGHSLEVLGGHSIV